MIRDGRRIVFIIGLVLLGFGIATLNANRSERASTIADELIEPTEVLPENEGKLVIVSGVPQLPDDELIIDEEADLKMKKAVRYERVPYQKVYAEEKRTVVVNEGEDKTSTLDDVTKTEYYVVQKWVLANSKRDAVISNDFKRYENPPAINLDALYESADLRISDFRIKPSDVSGYIQTKRGGFPADYLQDACAGYIKRSEIDLQAVTDEKGYGMLSNGDDIGSVHVNFAFETLESAEPVTVIGRQRGDTIVFEEDGPVSQSEHIRPGIVSREEFLSSITAEDASSRIYGVGEMVVGVILCLLSLNWRRSAPKKKIR